MHVLKIYFLKKGYAIFVTKINKKGISKLKGRFNVIYTPEFRLNPKSLNKKILYKFEI